MSLLTIIFREHSRGFNCNIPDYCCKRILGEFQGFGKVGNEEIDKTMKITNKMHYID
jgi:hypothetical protein